MKTGTGNVADNRRRRFRKELKNKAEKAEERKQKRTMKQRVYISGPITGDPDARTRFRNAEGLKVNEGFDVMNPFDNGVNDGSAWEEHMIADIRMLMLCDTIFMLNGWQSSKGARIEFKIAEEMGMDIQFESFQDQQRFIGVKNDKFATMVKASIREVMGTDFDQQRNDSKSRDVFFMRMIFTYHCREIGMTLKQIKTYIHRDHTTMLHYLKRYRDEFKYNSEFRDIANRVSNLLSKFVSE